VRLEVEASPTVEDLQAEIERLKDQLRSASQRAGERARELENARAKLDREAQRHGRLDGLRAKVDELRAEREHAALVQAKAELEREREELESDRAAVAAGVGELTVREQRIEAARVELAERERSCSEREAALHRSERMWEQMLDEREAALAERAQRLEERERALQAPVEIDEDVASERIRLQVIARSLEARERALGEHEASIGASDRDGGEEIERVAAASDGSPFRQGMRSLERRIGRRD